MLSIITILLYLAASFIQGLCLTGRLTTKLSFPRMRGSSEVNSELSSPRMQKSSQKVASFFGFFAVVLHGYLLHDWIDIGVGQNLTFFNMLSLALWLVALLILLTALRKPIENLIPFVFPVAAISVLLVLIFPNVYVVNTASNPKQLVHILLSVLTFGVLCIAAMQALVLAFLEHRLRYKHPTGFVQKLPPLETMESLLFQIIWLGFLLLTLVIGLSFYFFYGVLQFDLWLKIILSILAWLVFAILLLGRYLFGWRGRKAIYWTLCGVVLLIIIFFFL